MVEEQGVEDLVVVLGSPTVESAETFAETVINGDPSYAGPLAGVPLDLPVYHVLEPEIKQQADEEVYQRQVGLMEEVLDTADIVGAVHRVREKS